MPVIEIEELPLSELAEWAAIWEREDEEAKQRERDRKK